MFFDILLHATEFLLPKDIKIQASCWLKYSLQREIHLHFVQLVSDISVYEDLANKSMQKWLDHWSWTRVD